MGGVGSCRTGGGENFCLIFEWYNGRSENYKTMLPYKMTRSVISYVCNYSNVCNYSSRHVICNKISRPNNPFRMLPYLYSYPFLPLYNRPAFFGISDSEEHLKHTATTDIACY